MRRIWSLVVKAVYVRFSTPITTILADKRADVRRTSTTDILTAFFNYLFVFSLIIILTISYQTQYSF